MGLETHRTTSKHSFGHVALVAAAFLFVWGFIFPTDVLWSLAALTLIVSFVHTIVVKLTGHRIKVLSKGV